MKKFRYNVSFRVFHPDMDPDEICQKLNMQPTYKWRAGEGRKTPKGTSLPDVYKLSYCSFKLEPVEGVELVDFLKNWNDKLTPFKEYLNKISHSGGRLEYFIGWYSKENSGEVFDLFLIEGLMDLRIELAIDFYVVCGVEGCVEERYTT